MTGPRSVTSNAEVSAGVKQLYDQLEADVRAAMSQCRTGATITVPRQYASSVLRSEQIHDPGSWQGYLRKAVGTTRSRTDLADIGTARREVRAGHHEVRHSGATVRALPLQPHERDVALAGADQRVEVRVARMPASLAPDVNAEASRGHRAGGRQVVSRRGWFGSIRLRDALTGPPATACCCRSTAVVLNRIHAGQGREAPVSPSRSPQMGARWRR